MRLVFASADAILTIFSFEIAYYIRTHLHATNVFFLPVDRNIELALFSAAAWVLFGWQQRVADYLTSTSLHRTLRQTVRQCVLGLVLLVVFQYFLHQGFELSRAFLVIFALCNFCALFLFRVWAPAMLAAFLREFGQAYHLVLVGSPDRLAHLRSQLCESSLFRSEIVAGVSPENANTTIPALLSQKVVDEVIFDVDWNSVGDLEQVLQHCTEEGVRTRVAMGFFPHANSQLSLDRVGDVPLLTFSADPLEDLRLLVKRSLDVALSSVALILLLPLIGLIALLIKATSRGPVIFRQSRCGLNGRVFTLFKFRSMVENADELKAALAHLNEREVVFKMTRDPRVTPLGRILRKFSLDELPQLYNVLRGDMSLVGPRPPLPDEVFQYERWQRRRLRMRPGLTCLWVVMGRDQLDFNSWMRADLFYIDNWSLALDWLIILRTIPTVIRGRGAH
ncbi:MAG TPA: exopolysaccharide biosynthesis polyprenyl glycosylphosphotransferase [Bryobacteraceae bacterium]|jgi:exopolysaccharide biosynthesis polyprenyl glycosylphosphotransferase|nr:exopolysaccharide biosynthesis polyprenyl glycosylphosphotransferase [Bryobacteraceae bacterium]